MHSPNLERSISQASERLHATLIEMAERVAAEVRAEAEAEAQRYLERRRREADEAVARRLDGLSDVTRDLTSHIDRVRSEAEALSRSLEDALRRIREMQGDVLSQGNSDIPVSPIERHADEVISHEAILRAAQMAAAGSGRQEIEDVLRLEFSLRDPATVTDRILGPA